MTTKEEESETESIESDYESDSSSLSSKSSSSGEEEENELKLLTGTERLLREISLERERFSRRKLALESQRENLFGAKNSIATLITQITDYKNVLEGEKSELEAELASKEEEIEKEKSTTIALQKSIAEKQKEKSQLMQQISDVETQHEEALESEENLKNEMKKETVANLQTLMNELQRIEEANELLRLQIEKSKIHLEEENHQHEITKKELDKQSELTSKAFANLETLRVTNEALLSQLKAFKRNTISYSSTQRTTSPIKSNSYSTPTSPVKAASPISSIKTEESLEEKDGKVAPNYKLVRKLDVHQGGVLCSLIVGGQMWVGCSDGTIRIWEIETGQTLEDRKHHSGPVFHLILVKDKVWSCSLDKTILVWSPKKAQPEKRIQAGNKDKEVWTNAFMEADQFIWCGCSDGLIRLWDSKNMKLKKEMKPEGNSVGSFTSFIKRSNAIWSGTSQGTIYIWNCTTLKLAQTMIGHTAAVNSFTSIGPTSFSLEIWSCSADKTIRCWNAETYENLKVIETTSNVLELMQVRTSYYVWSGSDDSKIFLWDAKTYEQVANQEDILNKHAGAVNCITFVDKKNEIWTGSSDCYIYVWR
eukprot:TRINITY_DN3185_c0_g1_i1.p2 TRINITY_DN3185_c0_g1~~TRINITY_DN3185_c0_g1_i1.p2  ORF type:complete len:601 (+),score=236.39 TRINITY_DN3185_c0_g1_i1:27-1805(+)